MHLTWVAKNSDFLIIAIMLKRKKKNVGFNNYTRQYIPNIWGENKLVTG